MFLLVTNIGGSVVHIDGCVHIWCTADGTGAHSTVEHLVTYPPEGLCFRLVVVAFDHQMAPVRATNCGLKNYDETYLHIYIPSKNPVRSE